jgi:hypothetical protein
MSSHFSKLINLLETYRGHDQALSLIGYGCTMLSGTCSKQRPRLAEKFKKISSDIANSRVVLRLLDDFSMLGYTLSYGLGKKVRLQCSFKKFSI